MGELLYRWHGDESTGEAFETYYLMKGSENDGWYARDAHNRGLCGPCINRRTAVAEARQKLLRRARGQFSQGAMTGEAT